jgi:hypothetical protein
MDDACTQTRIGSTQQLLADRVRQRYARCRESLASFTPESSAPTIEVRAPLHLVIVRGDKPAAPGPAQAQPSSSTERFSTLFSQAYRAARQEQRASLANALDHFKLRARA